MFHRFQTSGIDRALIEEKKDHNLSIYWFHSFLNIVFELDEKMIKLIEFITDRTDDAKNTTNLQEKMQYGFK